MEINYGSVILIILELIIQQFDSIPDKKMLEPSILKYF